MRTRHGGLVLAMGGSHSRQSEKAHCCDEHVCTDTRYGWEERMTDSILIWLEDWDLFSCMMEGTNLLFMWPFHGNHNLHPLKSPSPHLLPTNYSPGKPILLLWLLLLCNVRDQVITTCASGSTNGPTILNQSRDRGETPINLRSSVLDKINEILLASTPLPTTSYFGGYRRWDSLRIYYLSEYAAECKSCDPVSQNGKFGEKIHEKSFMM